MKVKKMSQKQEKSVAEEFSAKTVVASGAKWGSKGDVRSDKYLIECKITQKSFYSLTKSTWEKIQKEAIKDGLRIPMMCIDTDNGINQFIVMLYTDIPEDIKEMYKDKHLWIEEICDRVSFRVRNWEYLFPLHLVKATWGWFVVMKRQDFSEYFM